MSAKVVFFFVFLIIASITMYYNIKNYQHAEKNLEYANEDLRQAHAHCLDVFSKYYSNDVVDQKCAVPENMKHIINE